MHGLPFLRPIFTDRDARPTPFGDSIFLCLRKVGEKDKPRGLRSPLDPRGNVLV